MLKAVAVSCPRSVTDRDFELRRGLGFNLLARPAFLHSVISSFFTENKMEVGPPGPFPRTATGRSMPLQHVPYCPDQKHLKRNPFYYIRSTIITSHGNKDTNLLSTVSSL